jgi:subtilisin family serine protease
VAVLDTGVDKTHPFLSGKVVEEACYSAGGNCPNGATSEVGSGAGVQCTYAAAACRHGTHVAGIAAGQGSSFSGVARGSAS